MILALNRLFSLATENNFTDDQEFSLTNDNYKQIANIYILCLKIRYCGVFLCLQADFFVS